MNRWLVPAVITMAIGICHLSAILGAEPSNPSPRAAGLELLFLDQMPLRIELVVEIDGQPVNALWDDLFQRIFEFFDRNGDAQLNPSEAARLPSSFAIRQILWGHFATFSGDAPAFIELDQDSDGTVRVDEMADYYCRSSLGGVLVGVGQSVEAAPITSAILSRLDRNNDGLVDESEARSALGLLAKLDQDDDDLIGPGEFVESIAIPRSIGAILLTSPAPERISNPFIDSLPFILLPLRTTDQFWAKELCSQSQHDANLAFSNARLLELRQMPPAVSWGVQFENAKPRAHVLHELPRTQRTLADGKLIFARDRFRMELVAEEGKLTEHVDVARKRLIAQFSEFDSNLDGQLDGNELGISRAGQLKQLLTLADRNEDARLGHDELNSWFQIQRQIAEGHVLLTILDRGTSLFEILDVDHDGGLSARELRSVWERLVNVGCVTNNCIDAKKVPRQFFGRISRGHPRSISSKPTRRGPAWFQAMDRNGDGDLSRREFVGQAELFSKLDLDNDGLLSESEAVIAPAAK